VKKGSDEGKDWERNDEERQRNLHRWGREANDPLETRRGGTDKFLA